MKPYFKTVAVTASIVQLSATSILFSGYIQSNADSSCDIGSGATGAFESSGLKISVNDTMPRHLMHLVDLSTIVVQGTVGTTLSLFGVAQPVSGPLSNNV